MREPRPTQRFPKHGKDLYEALRRDAEPVMVWVLSEEDEREVAVLQDYTLVWTRFFDPMLYFWPVDRQHVMVMFWRAVEDDLVKRLVKALLRDGADWVTVSRPSNKRRVRDHYGDANKHLQRHSSNALDTAPLPRTGS
jgi:hypothetical protein